MSRNLRDLFIKITVFKMKALYLNRFYSGRAIVFGKYFSIILDSSGSDITIGNEVQFRDFCCLRAGSNGHIVIGNGVFFNNNCSINCLVQINIGDNCQFGEGVKIYDHNHQYSNKELLINQQGYINKEIKIGNNCWIGSNVIILKGVEIGNNVVIGAGCTIFKSIESGHVVYNNQELIINKY